jgi:hypothetical protein
MIRKKQLAWIAAGTVAGVLLAMAGLWFGMRQAPMKPGMLGKESIQYRVVNDGIDYTTVAKSKYWCARTPDQAIHELFVAINTKNWDRVKQLTVGLEDFGREEKLSDEKRRECILAIGDAMKKGNGKLRLEYVIRQGNAWFVVLRYDVRGGCFVDVIPLSLARKRCSFYANLGDLDNRQCPFGQQLRDKKELAKLK